MAGDRSMNEKEADGYIFEINSEGEIVILQYAGTSGAEKVVIPEMINGASVSTIGENAFSENLNLKCVSIPVSVTNIESGAFKGCENLATADIHVYAERGRLTIAPDAFSEQITANYIEIIIQSIDRSCEFNVPEDLLDYDAYKETVYIGCRDHEIMLQHFNYVREKKAKENGEKKWDLKEWIFSPPGLEYEVEYISKNECRITRYNRKANSKVIIPDKISEVKAIEIGGYAFNGCMFMKSITIPACMERIERYAFHRCDNLSAIDIYAKEEDIEIQKFAFPEKAAVNFITPCILK